jgi:sialidase-1
MKKHVLIYKEKDRYCSFPHVSILPNGNLAVVYRKASKFSSDAAKSGIATHHDPDSSIEIIESTDMGNTWDIESNRTIYKTQYGVNDPALTILNDNSVIVRFVALDIRKTSEVTFQPKKIFSHRVEHGLVTSVVGNMIIKSVDSGVTWQEIGVEETLEIGPSCSRDPIVEMPDGSWLMPVYTGAPQRSDIAWVIRSMDQGRHWCEPRRIMSDESGRFSQLQGVNYNETSLLHLGNGEMIAMVRGDGEFHTTGDEFMPVGGVGSLFMARSYDSGMSWSEPELTGIWGQPGSLILLSNGDILCTYGYRKSPYGVRACVSKNHGKTWDMDNEIIVRDDNPIWDCGYPFTIELPKNKLFTVYYMTDMEGTRYVAGTHWNLK